MKYDICLHFYSNETLYPEHPQKRKEKTKEQEKNQVHKQGKVRSKYVIYEMLQRRRTENINKNVGIEKEEEEEEGGGGGGGGREQIEEEEEEEEEEEDQQQRGQEAKGCRRRGEDHTAVTATATNTSVNTKDDKTMYTYRTCLFAYSSPLLPLAIPHLQGNQSKNTTTT